MKYYFGMINLSIFKYLMSLVLWVKYIIISKILGLGFSGPYQTTILWAVFLLGIVVGLLNITIDELGGFLTSGTVLVLVSFLGIQGGVFDSVAPIIGNILTGILTLLVPAVIIVALKAVFTYASR